jgi:hypothetical protein
MSSDLEYSECICSCGHVKEDHIDYENECCYCDCSSYKEELDEDEEVSF